MRHPDEDGCESDSDWFDLPSISWTPGEEPVAMASNSAGE